MKIFEGTIFYHFGKPCLIIEATQEQYLLMIKGKQIEKISEILIKKGITDGKRVSIAGELGYHPELENYPDCKETLIFLSKSIKEI